MKTTLRIFATTLLAAVLASPVIISGCGGHPYRVYDPYYNGYRDWNHNENVYYKQWENETHRQHQEFRKRSDADQKEYWDWRHNHANDYQKH